MNIPCKNCICLAVCKSRYVRHFDDGTSLDFDIFRCQIVIEGHLDAVQKERILKFYNASYFHAITNATNNTVVWRVHYQ